MSTGGIFTLITNDGKQDRMLMATELLKARLRRIMKARAANGMDPTPTLVDIEKTHVLFMNAHFKPFAAIGYEYNKVRPSSGTVTLGNTVQFSIPQFGDFFHDMVLHVRLSAVTTSDADGHYRWVDFPGERLLDKVAFTVNGNPLDQYYGQDYNFYRQFELPASKRDGYYRCAGQQLPMKGQIVPSAGATTSGAEVVGFGETTAGAANTLGFWVDVTNGYQTVKTEAGHALTTSGHVRTDILEVTMPLLFWFNRDPRLAIPSVSIPFGQRFIDVDLAAYSTLARGMLVTGDASNGTSSSIEGTTAPTVPVCDLYVNNIFVNPEVHDIFIKRIGFNLIRVHRRQINRINDATNGELLLNNFKWPIECIYFGFRKVLQSTTAQTRQYLNGWHVFGELLGFAGNVTPDTDVINVSYDTVRPLVNEVTFQAHGIPIYNAIPAILYNQYFPLAYGDKMSTPSDPGAYLVTFNLYPGVYQPSGHLNVSRAREFYVKFDDTVGANERNLGTAIAASTDDADFLASATALNFLLISDGSAVLRYST